MDLRKTTLDQWKEKTDIAMQGLPAYLDKEKSLDFYRAIMNNEDEKKDNDLLAIVFMKQYGHLFEKKAGTYYFLDEAVKKMILYLIFYHIISTHFYQSSRHCDWYLDKGKDAQHKKRIGHIRTVLHSYYFKKETIYKGRGVTNALVLKILFLIDKKEEQQQCRI